MAASSSPPSPDNDQKREYVFKVLVIGEQGTGKTAIVKRYVHNNFSDHYKSTIGVDFALKVVKTNDGNVVRLQLWDIAGQERFGSMTGNYYREAVGCIVVYDLERPTTFNGVSKWKADLDSKVQLPNGNRVPCILLANKCDLAKGSLVNDTERLNRYCEDQGFAKWFETSAKENINIETAMQYIISEIMKHTDDTLVSRSSRPIDDTIRISETSSNTKREGGGGCCGGKS